MKLIYSNILIVASHVHVVSINPAKITNKMIYMHFLRDNESCQKMTNMQDVRVMPCRDITCCFSSNASNFLNYGNYCFFMLIG